MFTAGAEAAGAVPGAEAAGAVLSASEGRSPGQEAENGDVQSATVAGPGVTRASESGLAAVPRASSTDE